MQVRLDHEDVMEQETHGLGPRLFLSILSLMLMENYHKNLYIDFSWPRKESPEK